MKQVVFLYPNSATSNQNSSTSRLHARQPSFKHQQPNPLKTWLNSRHLKRLLIILVLCLAAPLSAKAASVKLAWDLGGQAVDGSKVFMRSENQAYDYSKPVWAGAGSTCTIDGLQNAQKYFFVARVFKGTDESGSSNEVFCTTPLPPNQPPVADAGPDIAVDAGASATLNGAGSSDADGSIVSYVWTQTDGPNVETAGDTGPQMTITIPAWTETATLVFRLDVTDDRGDTSSDTCQVTVNPAAASGGGSTDTGGSSSDSSGGYADADTVVGEDTLNDIIVDDGDAGATRRGNWAVSKADGAYGTRSMYSRDTTATYTFEAQTTGLFEVSVWWTQLSSRSGSAPIEIYDGANLLDVINVNQKIDGGQWNVLGTYQFSDYPKVVIVSTGNGSTCADAVEFMEIPPEEPVVTDYVIDDGDSGASSEGGWSVSNADGAYGTKSLFSRDPSATYTFQAPTAGRFKVSMWWTQYSSRSDNVPVEIYDGTSLLEVAYVNQKMAGGQWNVLGTYQFSDYPRVVIVSTGNGSTCADAVEFLAAAPVVEELIVIDDGDTGASAEGSWSDSNADGAYGTKSLFSRDPSATYTFQAHTAGRYEVSLWWTQYPSRSDNVPVEIFDGTSLLKVVYVNQKTAGSQWNVLGTYQFSDYPKVVIVSTGSGSTCADAVQYKLAP